MLMKRKDVLIILIFFVVATANIRAQNPDDSMLKLSGELFADERLLLNDQNDWAWNETRLTLDLDKRIAGNTKFHSEIWLRNIGLPAITSSADMFNKGIIDPYNLEIREAYVQINGFLLEKFDLKIGRQRIVWGTADKLNPTDNLNPYDMEDVLDFGRHRGSDAISMNYYFTNNFSVQGVFLPFFQPASMPVGLFAGIMNQEMDLPSGLVLKGFADTLLMPRYNLAESSVAGFRLKGFVAGIDFSASYVWGIDGLPANTGNTFMPVDAMGGINISSELSFIRTHIIGADLATSIGAVGFWAEGALFIPDTDVVMTNDLSALYPMSPVPVITDTLILDSKEPYLKFIVGADYYFPDGSYLNIQYMHGFIHERGNENMNDYFFMQYYKNFFGEKLKIAPLGGAIIVSDWSDIKENYALVYMPEITYQATGNTELSLSPVIFDGKGDNLFAGLKEYNMLKFKLKYSF